MPFATKFTSAVAVAAAVTLPVVQGQRADAAYRPFAGATMTMTTTRLAPNLEVPNSNRGQYFWLNVRSQVSGLSSADVYWRDQLQWGSQLERTRGSYDFSVFEQGLATAAARGGRFSFRIMAFCPGCGDNLTPDYIPRQTNGMPDWNSEQFLSSWENLMRRLGSRYGDDPRLGFIDIGGYGDFGEWGMNEGGGTPITSANAKRLMRAVIRAFPHKYTLINYMDKFPDMAVALSPKVGIRMDCIGGPYSFALKDIPDTHLAEVWRRAPVVGEWCPNPETTASRGLQHVDEAHLSMLSTGNFPRDYASLGADEQTAFRQAYVNSGFRYAVNRAEVPRSWRAGASATIRTTWQNLGVAPTYDQWNVVLRVINSAGRVVARQNVPVTLKDLTRDKGEVTVSQTLKLPAKLSGTHRLAVVVLDPSGYQAPMHLAIAGRSDTGAYRIGSMTIR